MTEEVSYKEVWPKEGNAVALFLLKGMIFAGVVLLLVPIWIIVYSSKEIE